MWRPPISFRENPDPRIPRCAVCRVPLSNGERTWCAEHQRQREARQRAGVDTDELDTRWHDRLTIWRTRPPLPTRIGDPASFSFMRRRDGWLLFMRGYPKRLPDLLAINESTHELRRFVEVPEYDVWNDLSGVRPAAHQEDFERRWGNPQPRVHGPVFLPRYSDARGQPDLRRLVDEAPMGVYGLVGWPYGLELRDICYGSNYRGPSSVTMTFVPHARTEVPVEVRIVSSDAIFHGVKHIEPEPKADSVALSLNLESEVFNGLLMPRGHPMKLTLFRLESSRTRLSGGAIGLPEDQLRDLLAHLVDLAHHPALVTELQAQQRANIGAWHQQAWSREAAEIWRSAIPRWPEPSVELRQRVSKRLTVPCPRETS